jgi:hypothetical protein
LLPEISISYLPYIHSWSDLSFIYILCTEQGNLLLNYNVGFFVANTFQIQPFRRDWRSRQIWLFVLCQEHNTDIDYQSWLHWHPFQAFATLDKLSHGSDKNYNVGCSGTPFCYIHAFLSHPSFSKVLYLPLQHCQT